MTPARIRTIRQQAGLSQTGLAALLRIADLRTIRRWEKGEIPISGPASIVLELLESGELPERFKPS
jgi:DNA-binding transcriptional regulator YiaG